MKELISIYVSLFLVFSPLFGQTKQEATIYMTSGFVGSVIVIKIGEKAIEVEMTSPDGQLLKQTIQKYMIYQLLSPDGKSLYTNPDAEAEYKKTFQEFKVKQKQSEQLMRSSEYERKEKWNIQLMGGVLYSNVALWGLRGDSLVAIDMDSTKTIYIGSIAHISNTTKGKRKTGMGAKIGGITGALIPITLVVVIIGACITGIDDGCEGGDGPSFSIGAVFIITALAAGVSGAIGAVFGAVIGGFFKYVEEYDMSDWSIEEKRAQIQEIMKK